MNSLPLISHRMFAAALGSKANAAHSGNKKSSVTVEPQNHSDKGDYESKKNAHSLPTTEPRRLLASVGLWGT